MPQLSTESRLCSLCLSGCNACPGIAPFCTLWTVAEHNVSPKRDKHTGINIKPKGEADRFPVNKKSGEKLVRFSLGTPLDCGLSSINGHRWNQPSEKAKWLVWQDAQGTRKEFIRQFLWDRDLKYRDSSMFISCTNNEILEMHREVVCPVYSAKEKGRFQRFL